MSEDLLSEINLDYFRDIKYTRKAFQMLPKLEKPLILDIGCGSGLPTIELAKLISIVSNKFGEIPSWGYKLIDYFSLPEDAWWTECYRPLEIRIKELYMKSL